MMRTKHYTSQHVVQDEWANREQHNKDKEGLAISEMEAMVSNVFAILF